MRIKLSRILTYTYLISLTFYEDVKAINFRTENIRMVNSFLIFVFIPGSIVDARQRWKFIMG